MISPLSPSSFSSLDSPTTSAVLKRKQMVAETSSTNKNEDIPSVLFLGDANQPSPLLDAVAPAASEVSSSKRLKTNSAPVAATAPALNESGLTNYLEREWALAATRNNGQNQNVFPAYLANMTQLSSQQRHPSQQPLAVVTPKDNASFEAYLASVGIQPRFQQQQQQQRQLPPMPTRQQVTPKQPKPLTKAKKNKLEAAAMIEEINAINLDDEDDKDREIYDSCPEVAAKIKQFLKIPGVNRKIFLETLQMDESYETLKKFIEGTGQTQCRSKVYRRSYIFFEKLRLLESRDKSEARLRNEKVFPLGFSTKKSGTVVEVQNDTSDEGRHASDDGTVYLI